jgi:predicted TIM-barrel fold metal-dependent hydrolase
VTIPLFDTHAHLISNDWDRYRPQPLRPDMPTPDKPGFAVTVESLVDLMNAENVTSACLVQRGHVYAYDNSYIIDSAQKYPGRLLPVVILDATDPKTAGTYRAMVRNDQVRGFRMAQSRPHVLDTAWLNSPEAMEVWKACADLGTPVTLIVFMNQLSYNLPAIRMIARMFPDLPILLDHGAMPFGMTQYEVGLAREAGETIVMPKAPHFGIDTTIGIFEDIPNVHFKITEINLERFAAEGVRAAHVVRRMVDSFGPDRLMWGSDIGQSMLWSYEEKTAMARAAAEFLTDGEARKFLHDNATRVYSSAAA